MLKAILFDFDGVIIDSSKMIYKYFREISLKFKNQEILDDEIKSYDGLTTKDAFQRMFPDYDDEKIKKVGAYGVKLSLKLSSEIPLMSNALDVIMELQSEYKLALVTNRGKHSVNMLRNKYSLDNHFQVIIDREDVQNHKPHPEPLFKALKALGTKNIEAIYIGDTESDVGAARNAKMPCVLISKSKKNLGADYYISSIKELPKLIRKIQSKRKAAQADK